MICKSELDNRIVVWGMSCAGKTTFSKQLRDHQYYCFDAMFHWHLVETLGLSISANLAYVREQCVASKFVVDGWHLSDLSGSFLPEKSTIYVVYSSYDTIISQYRVTVSDHNQHRSMFKKWYQDIDYEKFIGTRYFKNDGHFVETTSKEFLQLINDIT